MLFGLTHQILACVAISLATALDVNDAGELVINAQGQVLQPAQRLDVREPKQLAARKKEQKVMMRRDVEWSSYKQSSLSNSIVAPVKRHMHSLISATGTSSVQSEDGFDGGKLPGKPSSSTDIETIPAVATFALQGGPYNFMHHQVQSISETQWPANFCINMMFVAPEIGGLPEKVRAIAVLGGHATCGSFFIFIDDMNRPGMGVRCDDHHCDPPLLAAESLGSDTSHFMQFCYDTQIGRAEIWVDHKMHASDSSKNWYFHREGLVSIFVGSHNITDFEELLQEADKAELKQMYLTDSSTDPVTSTTTTTTTSVDGNRIVELDVNSGKTTTLGIELDVNSGAPAPPSTTGPEIIYITSTTKPFWDRTHHEQLLNSSTVDDTKTMVVRTEITTVTEYDTNTTDDHRRNISIPGPKSNVHTHVESVTVTVLPTVSDSQPVVDWSQKPPPESQTDMQRYLQR